MKVAKLPLIITFALVLVTSVVVHAQIPGQVFTVNSTADTTDAATGDRVCADANGQCTFRAAIQEANANSAGRDIIIFSLPWPATIEISQGQIPISSPNLSVVGPGARRLTIRPNPAQPPFTMFDVTGANVVIRGLTIKNAYNGKFLDGAAMRVRSIGVRLTEVAFLENQTAKGGAAILNIGGLTITRSLFAQNSSFERGGAIVSASGSTTNITNTTFSQNFSTGDGGAIWNAGNLLLVNCTISNNLVNGNARSIFNDSTGTVNVLNTIIGSDVGSASIPSLSGAFISLGNNIITDARSSTGFVNGVNNDQVSDGNAINPLLGNLADNGGQTDTRALLPGSPAINAGNSCVWNGSCPSLGQTVRLHWDQRRGFLRGGFFDAVDVGAYEITSGSSSESGSVGIFLPSPTARYLNSFAVFTNVVTNEKIFRPIKADGRFSPPNLGNEIHVFELRTKRTPGFVPFVVAIPD